VRALVTPPWLNTSSGPSAPGVSTETINTTLLVWRVGKYVPRADDDVLQLEPLAAGSAMSAALPAQLAHLTLDFFAVRRVELAFLADRGVGSFRRIKRRSGRISSSRSGVDGASIRRRRQARFNLGPSPPFRNRPSLTPPWRGALVAGSREPG